MTHGSGIHLALAHFAQHISDFYMPAYTRSDPPSLCIILREGHRPKMFLWMVEEYAFILCHLHRDDCDGFLVLGHELLLLACSQCCQKREGGRGSCCMQAQLPLDRLPACTFQNLGACAVQAAGTIQLERLAWAVFDNIMGPVARRHYFLSWRCIMKSVECQAGKAYKGLHMCTAQLRTFASFGADATSRPRPGDSDLKKPGRPQCYSMTWDVRKESLQAHILLSK